MKDSAEQIILEAWRGILKIDEIKIDDCFFRLGGNSILAAKLMVKINKEFGIKIPLGSIFKTRTLGGMYQLIQNFTEKVSHDFGFMERSKTDQ